jgi:hypothetical protein
MSTGISKDARRSITTRADHGHDRSPRIHIEKLSASRPWRAACDRVLGLLGNHLAFKLTIAVSINRWSNLAKKSKSTDGLSSQSIDLIE